MTAIDRFRHDRLPAPETDGVSLLLRHRLRMVLALAVLLLAGVLWAACHLTILAPTTAAADPWGPRLARPSLAFTQARQLSRLLHLEPPHEKEPAGTSVPAGPLRLDPAVRLLVDQGWPGLRPAAIPATARMAGIVTAPDKASP
ncbi:hypothetical protein [Azospirillum sp. B506]|uniref:hypothetical protein n=1 Tax=Azospirillum sp. B506 TaxID=137721 RepID=UPI0005B2AACB|nr:hypothetical protein [Azospirillum sp. B506]